MRHRRRSLLLTTRRRCAVGLLALVPALPGLASTLDLATVLRLQLEALLTLRAVPAAAAATPAVTERRAPKPLRAGSKP